MHSITGRWITPAVAIVALMVAARSSRLDSASPFPCDPGQGVKVAPPPGDDVYHSAYAAFSTPQRNEDYVTAGRIGTFERLAAKPITWAYFSNNWTGGRITFPARQARTIAAAGRIPFVRMMPRSRDFDPRPDPVFPMQKIIDGAFDRELIGWALDAKAFGSPLMVEFGAEVTGDWFAWNGRWNGGGRTDGYGDPRFPDGPERYRDAYRHIVDLFRRQGTNNITWVFHVADYPWPETAWNRMKNYYPGDAYIDWIGVTTYGATQSNETWQPLAETLADVYAELAAVSRTRPIALLEWAVVSNPAKGNKAAWIEEAFAALNSGRFPRIKVISWWHERYYNNKRLGWSDLRIDSSPAALAAYRKGVADDRFTTTPAYTCSDPATPTR